MNKIKFLQVVALSILLAIAFSSCKTSMDSQVRDVYLDMTKVELVAKMGKKYEVLVMKQTERGDEEVIQYTAYRKVNGKKIADKHYIFRFLNNELKEYKNENAKISSFDAFEFYKDDEE